MKNLNTTLRKFNVSKISSIVLYIALFLGLIASVAIWKQVAGTVDSSLAQTGAYSPAAQAVASSHPDLGLAFFVIVIASMVGLITQGIVSATNKSFKQWKEGDLGNVTMTLTFALLAFINLIMLIVTLVLH